LDITEGVRRERVAELNAAAAERTALEAQYGQVWDTTQLQQDFRVLGFLAPYVTVQRIIDGAMGSLEFQHSPRFYFNFVRNK